jgi:hypothetical protein
MEDVLRGVAEECADLRACEEFVEAGDVTAVVGPAAVVGVALDLDGESLRPEEEVRVAATAGGGGDFGLAFRVQSGVVHVEAGEGFYGGAGAGVGEQEPVAGFGSALDRCVEGGGDGGEAGQGRAAYAVHGAAGERGIEGDEGVVPGPGP